jgi:hypothetical protein
MQRGRRLEVEGRRQRARRAYRRHQGAANRHGKTDGAKAQGGAHHQEIGGTIGEKNSYDNDPNPTKG